MLEWEILILYSLKVGITSKENINDLIFGKCVNFAVGIANRLSNPYSFGISYAVYSKLNDDKIFAEKKGQKSNMWIDYNFKWKDEEVDIKKTKYTWGIS